MNKNYAYFVNYLNKNLSDGKNKVLDFGAGEGILLGILLENNIDAFGVDVNHTNNKLKYANNDLIKSNRLKLLLKKRGYHSRTNILIL